LSVLSGECALHSNALNSNTVDFEFIKMRLQLSIPTFVAEPESQEFFECAINLGASESSFITELIRSRSTFVNQKHRQLRLQAFVDTNKVNINCPRTRIASLKIAYRKNPSHGYCPTPEATFHKAPLSMVLKLEELLHYFHVCCNAAVAVFGAEHQQDALLANVDVCAAEAFVTASDKFTLLEMQNQLFTATHTDHDQFAAVAEHSMPQTLDKQRGVGGFQMCPRENNKTSAVAASRMLPKLITFDEST